MRALFAIVILAVLVVLGANILGRDQVTPPVIATTARTGPWRFGPCLSRD